MALTNNSLLLSLLFLVAFQAKGISTRSFVLEDSHKCEKISYPAELTVVILKTYHNSSNLINANINLPFNFGDNVAVNVFIETLTPKGWVHIFTINEKNSLCTFISTYMGQFFYDIESAAGLAPKECPLPKRSYRIKNYLLDFEKLKLQTFPKGKLRLTMKFKEKSNDRILMCHIFVLSNQ